MVEITCLLQPPSEFRFIKARNFIALDDIDESVQLLTPEGFLTYLPESVLRRVAVLDRSHHVFYVHSTMRYREE